MAIGTYTFLPWLRQGIANNIQTADMDASVKTRASVAVSLNIKGSGLPEILPPSENSASVNTISVTHGRNRDPDGVAGV